MNNFDKEVSRRIKKNFKNLKLLKSAKTFTKHSINSKYSYNFSFLGRPIIQYPQDILAIQELIYNTKPDLIIETGIAHGGSLIFHASILALLDICDEMNNKKNILYKKPKRLVLGIDIDIRKHNKKMILKHPMKSRIQMIEGSSVDAKIVEKVYRISKKFKNIMVCLDSHHTHNHVLSELNLYAPLVSKGNYCIVFDTLIDSFSKKYFKDRPWGPGNNPMTAVKDFLKKNKNFQIDKKVFQKLLISNNQDGYLRRIK